VSDWLHGLPGPVLRVGLRVVTPGCQIGYIDRPYWLVVTRGYRLVTWTILYWLSSLGYMDRTDCHHLVTCTILTG
jgi:hypothetical protein